MVKTLKQFISENKDDHTEVINALGDALDKHTEFGDYRHSRSRLTNVTELKKVIAKADTKHLHILKYHNNGVSGIVDHPAIKHINAELKKRKSNPSDEQVEKWCEKYYPE